MARLGFAVSGFQPEGLYTAFGRYVLLSMKMCHGPPTICQSPRASKVRGFDPTYRVLL